MKKKERIHNPDQVEHFIRLLQKEELSVSKSVEQCVVLCSSTYILL